VIPPEPQGVRPPQPADSSTSDGWRTITLPDFAGNKTMAADAAPGSFPVLARPGMMVNPCNSRPGIIIAMTKDYCIARKQDGTEECSGWGEVMLQWVQPDPAYLSPEVRGEQSADPSMPDMGSVFDDYYRKRLIEFQVFGETAVGQIKTGAPVLMPDGQHRKLCSYAMNGGPIFAHLIGPRIDIDRDND